MNNSLNHTMQNYSFLSTVLSGESPEIPTAFNTGNISTTTIVIISFPSPTYYTAVVSDTSMGYAKSLSNLSSYVFLLNSQWSSGM